TFSGFREFQSSTTARTFWTAVVSVNGGSGGRSSGPARATPVGCAAERVFSIAMVLLRSADLELPGYRMVAGARRLRNQREIRSGADPAHPGGRRPVAAVPLALPALRLGRDRALRLGEDRRYAHGCHEDHRHQCPPRSG